MTSAQAHRERILAQIAQRSLKVGVIGLGYVGLPLSVEKAKAGFETTGFDIQHHKVAAVNEGRNYIGDVVSDELRDLVTHGHLRATDKYEFIAQMDFVALCVPTPIDERGIPDTSYIEDSAHALAPYLKPGTMVVLESTTYPGTTRELLVPILEKGSGLTSGVDLFVAFSPERVDPGNAYHQTANTPKVVGALDEVAADVICAMYKAVITEPVVRVSSPEIAEMEKILENAYRNVNVGLVNEIAQLCDLMGIDIWEVVDAAATKPFGFQSFKPGLGVGGHCIPVDPGYLVWKAHQYEAQLPILTSSMKINQEMPIYCVDRIAQMLNLQKLPVCEAKILIMGMAYKADIDDCRESPSIVLAQELLNRGAEVSYYDPYITTVIIGEQQLCSEAILSTQALQRADIVVIATDHSDVDYQYVIDQSRAVFDTRGVSRHYCDPEGKVELL